MGKAEQVILYVLSKSGGKPNFGETVLHKLMYFIDFDYYEKYNKSLTGMKYKKNQHGPTFVNDILRKMKEKELIQLINKSIGEYKQKKYIALKPPDLEGISAIEIQHIDSVLNKHSDKNAQQIEAYSHKDVPWVITKPREIIPYESVFYRDELYSVKDSEDEL